MFLFAPAAPIKKEDGTMSSPDAAIELRKNLKALAQEAWPKDQVRINASGCLGQCERGISCAIYPQNHWLLELKEGQEQVALNQLKKLVEAP